MTNPTPPPPRSLHRNAELQSKLDAMVRRWNDDWRFLDELHPTTFSEHELVHLDMVKIGIEQAAQRLTGLLQENQGKRTTDWK